MYHQKERKVLDVATADSKTREFLENGGSEVPKLMKDFRLYVSPAIAFICDPASVDSEIYKKEFEVPPFRAVIVNLELDAQSYEAGWRNVIIPSQNELSFMKVSATNDPLVRIEIKSNWSAATVQGLLDQFGCDTVLVERVHYYIERDGKQYDLETYSALSLVITPRDRLRLKEVIVCEP